MHEPRTQLSQSDVDAILQLVAKDVLVVWSISYTNEYTNVSWTFSRYDDDDDGDVENAHDDLVYLQQIKGR